MKILVIILVATVALTSADIHLRSANSNDNLAQGYYLQPQQQDSYQQAQYTTPNALSDSFVSSILQYLPQSHKQQRPPAQLQPQYSQNYAATTKQQLPMPSDIPDTFSYQPAVKPGRRHRPRTRIVKKPIVTKNFYIHSAPEETEAEIEEELANLPQQPRKHYNVLFVKTPSQTNKAAALNLAKTLKEEKTVVYVLAKKTSAGDLQDAIRDTPQPINKPEVFFIKYHTNEEANNAQRQIQSQYDSLGGSSTITDEGVAPATSVIGSLESPEEEDEEEEQNNQQRQQQSLDNPQEEAQSSNQYDELHLVNSLLSSNNNDYLPPSRRF